MVSRNSPSSGFMPCFSAIQSINSSQRSREKALRRISAVLWQTVQLAKVSDRPSPPARAVSSSPAAVNPAWPGALPWANAAATIDAFRISRIEDAVRSISPSDYYDGLALTRAADTIGAARRGIVVAALAGFGSAASPVTAWLEAGGERIGRTRERLQSLTEGGDITVSRLSVAAGLMSDLTGL